MCSKCQSLVREGKGFQSNSVKDKLLCLKGKMLKTQYYLPIAIISGRAIIIKRYRSARLGWLHWIQDYRYRVYFKGFTSNITIPIYSRTEFTLRAILQISQSPCTAEQSSYLHNSVQLNSEFFLTLGTQVSDTFIFLTQIKWFDQLCLQKEHCQNGLHSFEQGKNVPSMAGRCKHEESHTNFRLRLLFEQYELPWTHTMNSCSYLDPIHRDHKKPT